MPAGDEDESGALEDRGPLSCRDVVVCVELAADDDVITSTNEMLGSLEDAAERSPIGSRGDGSLSDTDGSDICDEVAPPADGVSDCAELRPPGRAPSTDTVCPLGSVTNCLPVTANGGQFLVVELSGVGSDPVEGGTGGTGRGTNDAGEGAGDVPPLPPDTLAFREASIMPSLPLKVLRGTPVFSEVLNSSCLSPDAALSVLDGLGASDSSSEASDVTVVLAKPLSSPCVSIEVTCSPEPPNSPCQSLGVLSGDEISPEMEENCIVPEVTDDMVLPHKHVDNVLVFDETKVGNCLSPKRDSAASGHKSQNADDKIGRGRAGSGELCGVRVVVTSSHSPPASPACALRRPGVTSSHSPPASPVCALRRPGSWHGSTAVNTETETSVT